MNSFWTIFNGLKRGVRREGSEYETLGIDENRPLRVDRGVEMFLRSATDTKNTEWIQIL